MFMTLIFHTDAILRADTGIINQSIKTDLVFQINRLTNKCVDIFSLQFANID